jgi:hypothetical protein
LLLLSCPCINILWWRHFFDIVFFVGILEITRIMGILPWHLCWRDSRSTCWSSWCHHQHHVKCTSLNPPKPTVIFKICVL